MAEDAAGTALAPLNSAIGAGAAALGGGDGLRPSGARPGHKARLCQPSARLGDLVPEPGRPPLPRRHGTRPQRRAKRASRFRPL